MGKYGVEGTHLEFKSKYTKKALNVINSFLNSDGGVILFAVDDEGDPIRMNDKQLDELQLQVSSALYDAIAPDPSLYLNTQKENNEVIQVKVLEGDNKPYCLREKGINSKGVFIRKGSSTRPATMEEIKDMIRKSDGVKFEELRSPIQNLTFNKAREFFADNDLNLDAGMKSLGLVQLETNLYTNLALILSDQNPFTFKAATFSDSNKTKFLSRREFSGSVLQQIDEVLDFIDIINKNTFEIQKQYRREKSDFPKDAVREAVVNAAIHRDYYYEGPTLVKICPEELEITSLGPLVKGIQIDDLLRGIHIPRNRNLSNIFYRLGLIEAYGTGIVRIYSDYSQEEVKPKIELSSNVFKLRLPNRNKSSRILEIENNKKQKEREAIHLTPSQIQILTTLEKDNYSLKKELMEKSHLKPSTFYKAFKTLENNEFIIQGKEKVIELTETGKQILKSIL